MPPRSGNRPMVSSGTIRRLSRSGPVTRSNSAALHHTRPAPPKEQDANRSDVPDPSVNLHSAVAPKPMGQWNQVDEFGKGNGRANTVRRRYQEHTDPIANRVGNLKLEALRTIALFYSIVDRLATLDSQLGERNERDAPMLDAVNSLRTDVKCLLQSRSVLARSTERQTVPRQDFCP